MSSNSPVAMWIPGMVLVLLTFSLSSSEPLEPLKLSVSSAVLGDGWLDISPPRRVASAGAGERRLALTAPQSSFSVAACASITGLPAAKQSALVAASFTKCINVFNVLIAGHSGLTACGDNAYMLWLANIFAEMLDNDKNGVVDDPNVVSHMDSFSNSGAKPVMLVGCNSNQEEASQSLESVATGDIAHSAQGWKMPNGQQARLPLTEEVIHFVQKEGWGKAYPVFAGTWTSHLGLCVKQAQCIWYMHPENPGCSNAAGTKCTNSEVTCAGACASFSTPGQCYTTEHNCGAANCDAVEFFNQVFQILYESPFFGDGVYQKLTDSGANTKTGLETKMRLTPACTDLLNDFNNAAYKLARNKLTGVYTVTNGTAVSSPSPSLPTTSGKLIGGTTSKALETRRNDGFFMGFAIALAIFTEHVSAAM